MKKNHNLLVVIMALVGTICTGIIVCILLKDRIKECPLFSKFFEEDDDLDFDFDDEFEEIESEDAVPEEESIKAEPVVEEEPEPVMPKVRRGYIPLKFTTDETA